MKSGKNLNFVLIKPAGPGCNLNCHYCFYLEKTNYFNNNNNFKMSEDILRKLMTLTLRRPGHPMSFGWQGGEPTLLGLPFFRKVVALQKELGEGMRISNLLQTNGIKLDKEWAEFLKENDFLVGLSLDGPAHVHDKYRVGKGNKPTHSIVERCADLLMRHEVNVNAISVVTDYSSKYAEEIYIYLKEIGFKYLQFIPCLEAANEDRKVPAEFSVSPGNYGEFLCQIFDLWKKDWVDGLPTTSERFMDNMFMMYLGNPSADCTFKKECGDYLVIEHNGEIFSCDFFVEDAWKLGNIMDAENLDLVLNGRRQGLFKNMKSMLHKRCLRCEYKDFCYGGCIKDRLRIKKDKRLNHFCQSYKMFHEHTKNNFESLVKIYSEKMGLAK